MLQRRLLLLTACLIACGCGGGPSGGSSSQPQPATGGSSPSKGELRGMIGVSLLTFENPFFKIIADHIEREAAEHGYRVVSLSADEDPAKQSKQLEDFIVQKVAAIVLSPVEARSVVPVVRQANAAGIPVFTVDIPILESGVEIVSQIATDNFGGGREAAQAMIEAIGSGKVAILHFRTAESCRLRVAGFREVIEEHNRDAAAPIEIVAELDGGGAKDKGRTSAADALQANPDLRGIFAINDPSALGAVAAVVEAGRSGQVAIIGFDGQREGKQAIRDGLIYADPIQYPEKMGIEVVRSIVAHLSGRDVPAEQYIPTSLYRQADGQQDPDLE